MPHWRVGFRHEKEGWCPSHVKHVFDMTRRADALLAISSMFLMWPGGSVPSFSHWVCSQYVKEGRTSSLACRASFDMKRRLGTLLVTLTIFSMCQGGPALPLPCQVCFWHDKEGQHPLCHVYCVFDMLRKAGTLPARLNVFPPPYNPQKRAFALVFWGFNFSLLSI